MAVSLICYQWWVRKLVILVSMSKIMSINCSGNIKSSRSSSNNEAPHPTLDLKIIVLKDQNSPPPLPRTGPLLL